MRLRHQITRITSLENLFEKYFNEDSLHVGDEMYFLVDLVHLFRPNNPDAYHIVSIHKLLEYLKSNPSHKEKFIHYLKLVFTHRKFSDFLADAGILKDSDFLYEVKKRLFAQILPEQPASHTLEYILSQVFYKKSDAKWVSKIPKEEFYELFDLLDLGSFYKDVKEFSLVSEVTTALSVISQRVSGRVMERDVLKMVPEYDHFESPFVAFEKELLRIIHNIRMYKPHSFSSNEEAYGKIHNLYIECEKFVTTAFDNSSKYGISLKVNQNLLRIKQQLRRIRDLFDFLIVNKEEDKRDNVIKLFLLLVQFNCYKNNVRQLIAESTEVISYEITKHTAKTGETYITESSSEYWKMFRAALGGGMIVGFLCVFKLLLSKIDTSGFGHAFYYSMNYSLGFIAIYLCHYTLATKQPAMTAATLSNSLKESQKQNKSVLVKYSNFASLFARLFRSQFIAFVGNVVIAFPVSLLGIWLLDLAFDYNIAAAKTQKLLGDLDPIHSPAIFHASIAGVFLFLSGIISGNVANKNKHERVYYRIQENPFLKLSIGKERSAKIANWLEKNWPGVVSNGWFGVFLGSTASIGIFLGLNIDIRHITFASGNFALGLYGNGFTSGFWTYFWCIMGIGLIGFFNFIVSFSLSLILAFRSRNIPLSELRLLHKAISKQFRKAPMTFFLPPNNKTNIKKEL
ncbi:MAG: recombinase [Flavobacterium sp.]|nr:recombinase [Candidatus Neoflavobacterium equi]